MKLLKQVHSWLINFFKKQEEEVVILDLRSELMPHHPPKFTGKVLYGNEEYMFKKNGKNHRENGPAYFYQGEERYYLDGRHYSKEEWFNSLTEEKQINYLWNLNEKP